VNRFSRRNQNAFTLLELVLATTVTVMVTGGTLALLRSAGAARQRVNRQMAMQMEARAAVNAIATALRNAGRLDGSEGILEGTDEFRPPSQWAESQLPWDDDVPADRIRFFTIDRTSARRGQPESDVKQCEFFLSDVADQAIPSLMQRIDPTRNEPPDYGGLVQQVAGNVLALDLAYHDGMQWQDQWPAESKSWPLAIRISLAVTDNAKPPKLLTASRIVNFPHRTLQRSEDKR